VDLIIMPLKIILVSSLHNDDGVKKQSLTNSNSNIYITIIVVGVHNTDSYYVDTIPVVQEQPYDQYDIAQHTGTITVVQEQLYD
jgi:hypothetical protein